MHRRMLLVLSIGMMIFGVFGCGEKELIVNTPQWAENSYMSDDGRLFITGGSAGTLSEGFIMEITQNTDGSFEENILYQDDAIVFMGITAHEGYLYVNAIEASELPNKIINKLFIARLDEITPDASQNLADGVFSQVIVGEFSIKEIIRELIENKGKLENVPIAVANGLGIDSNGYLYIADEFGSRIIQCHITEDDPTRIEDVKVWLREEASFPNGIVINGNILYFTELLSGNVKKVIIGDTAEPASVQTIYTRPGAILDDLTLYKEGVIVASCIDGVVFYLTDPDSLNEMGRVVFETPLETFVIPTSISIGQPPMFQEGDIIVTEGGLEPLDFGGWRVSLAKEIRFLESIKDK